MFESLTLLNKIINELTRHKNHEQRFYEFEGKTEEDKLINKVTQNTWDMAIDIVSGYLTKESE